MRPAFQQFVHIMPENLTCNGPEWTNGTVVSKLQWKTFKCPKSESCPTKCSCWKIPNKEVFLIDCSYKNLTAVPTNMNGISYYRSEINQSIGIPLLTKLRLANNNISDVSVKELPLNVEVLELHNNSIKRLKSEVIQYLRNSTTLKTLTLHGNPWTCDCDSRDFVDFIQSQTSKRILNLSLIECTDIKVPILKIRMEDVCPNNVMILIVGVGFAVIITALIISTAIALYYRYQREIKVWLYAHEFCLWLVTENELDKNKLYDAFISYSHHDEDFVVNELIKKLEDGPRPFKLCVYFREWLAGEYIPTQIARSVENSRRTIVVLSTNFINSVWGRMEFKAAHCQALSEGRTRVILILYGEINITDDFDPDLKAYLNMHTYIKWGDPSFWDKLRYALPHHPELKSNYSYGETISDTFALDVIRQQ
ncbi:protein toll-like [Megachile rotundata]|uniref:protein toll-like n=1 Tax=Megachile rotundata TaxID=143995 RepID=UPI003FD4C065